MDWHKGRIMSIRTDTNIIAAIGTEIILTKRHGNFANLAFPMRQACLLFISQAVIDGCLVAVIGYKLNGLCLIIRDRVKPRFFRIGIVVEHDNHFTLDFSPSGSFSQLCIRRIKCGHIRHVIMRQAERGFCRLHTQVAVVVIVGQVIVPIRQRAMRNHISRSCILHQLRRGRSRILTERNGLVLIIFGHSQFCRIE